MNRGVEDVLIACMDWPKSIPEAIESPFPQAQEQLCVVHLLHKSLGYVWWKERKAVASKRWPKSQPEKQMEAVADLPQAQQPRILNVVQALIAQAQSVS